MPPSMRTALRERADPGSLALVATLVAAVTLAFGFFVETALLMFGGAVVATLADAAVAAGRLHRQTVRAGVGVVVVNAADQPLTAPEVAAAAELDPDWIRRLLSLLVVRRDVERRGDGYLAGGILRNPSKRSLL